MVDLELLAEVAAGAELPPTVRRAVDALVAAWRVDVVQPPGVPSAVKPGTYALVEVKP